MRKIWDIHGGVHPLENKHQSVGGSIAPAGIPDELVLPLSQHIGAPAKAIVKPGDVVLKGQKIAAADGMMSVPVHAPTSGVVVAVEARPLPHASGMSGPAVVIRPDGEDRWATLNPQPDYTALDRAELIRLIQEAGLCGMGGAGFPTHVKLNPPPSKPIRTLILNGTECEPYITADDVLMRERAPEVIEGVKILAHLLKPEEVLIGIEDNKPEAIAAMQKAAEGTGFEIVVFPTKYPSGGEKQLIQILTGREVPSGGLPADLGIVCQNVGTTRAIYRAVVKGEPLIDRVTTITGEAVQKPGNYDVLIGTPMRYLLERAGVDERKFYRLVMGGPMMGFTMHSDRVPLVKSTNCLLVPSAQELPPPEPAQACIRCGMCAEACPVSLLPQQMYWYSRSQEFDKLEGLNLFDCIECGACSYVCPSQIPLVQYYRAAKAEIRTRAQEKTKADAAKVRFEAKQTRLQREEEEKEAARKARQAAKQAAASSQAASGATDPSEADPIAAAVARAQARKAAEAAAAAADPRGALVQAVEAAEKKLATTQEKLEQARGTDKEAAFQSSLEKLQAKLGEARQALAAHDASAGTAPAAAAESLDPIQAAIERAKAKRASQGDGDSVDASEKLTQAVEGARKRLETARAKLAEAEAAGAASADALRASLPKLEAKLQEAEQALSAVGANTAPTEAAAPEDPVQAAIERAKAKREAQTTGGTSEAGKAAAQRERLNQQIATTREKLAQAEAEGAPTAEALRTALARLEAKLAEADATS